MAVCRLLTLMLLLAAAAGAGADTVRVAVAANFAEPLERLQSAFERESGHRLTISSASTGTLYAQIVRGAPFDVFLAADRERPEKLIDAGLAERASAFVYARGRLALWSADESLIDGTPAVLRTGRFEHLALANPRTAPYGAAALQVIANLGLEQALSARLVRGENVAQTWHFVASGNAELGFIALAQLVTATGEVQGSRWLVPQSLHDSIEQMAVLLTRAREHEAARVLMTFLRSDAARQTIAAMGYDSEASSATP